MSRPEDEEFAEVELDEIDELWDEELEDGYEDASSEDNAEVDAEKDTDLSELEADVDGDIDAEIDADNALDEKAKKKISPLGPVLLLSILGGAGFLVYKTILNPPQPQIIPAITAQTPEMVETQTEVIPVPEETSDLQALLQDDTALEEQKVTEDGAFSLDNALPELQENATASDDDILTPFPEFNGDVTSGDLPELTVEEETVAENEVTVEDNPFDQILEPELETVVEPELEIAEEISNPFDEDALLSKTEDESLGATPDISTDDVEVIPMDAEQEIAASDEIDQIFEEEELSMDVKDAENATETEQQLIDLAPVEEVNAAPKTEEKAAEENIAAETPKESTSKEVVVPEDKPKEAPKAVAKPKAAPKIHWIIRAVQPGKAVISDKNNTIMQSIEIGDKVSGIGKVESIQKISGKWVIQGSSGQITQ